MTDNEYTVYWRPVSQGDWKVSQQILALFELDPIYSGWIKEVELTEERKAILKALAGPHGKTIAKAIAAKKGLEINFELL